MGAFGFLHPGLLWGLLLAGIPIIIHLLSKRRYRRVRWAAQEWLLAALKKSARRMRLEQLLLLALRTLILLLVALAVARPMAEQGQLALFSTIRTHRVILLDGSLSMGVTVAGVSRFERAVRLAESIVRMSRPGDAISLLLVAEPVRTIVPGPDTSRDAVLAELANLKVTSGGANLNEAFARAAQLFELSRYPRREVYVISDLQRSTWAAQQLAPEQVRAIGSDVEIVVVDVGSENTLSNAAIAGLSVEQSVAVTSRPAEVRVTVRNYGGQPLHGLGVEVAVNGRSAGRQAIELQPGAEREVSFTVQFTDAGFQQLEARIDSDLLPLDDRRWLALPARERIRVLLVDGEPAGGGFASETGYLKVALVPDQELTSLVPFETEIVAESDLIDTELERYDLVCLCNIGQWTESEARRIEQYVRRGGNVLIFLGDQVDVASYNEQLYRDGKGILPVRLIDRVGDPVARETVFRLDPGEYRHPVVKPFEGAPSASLLSTMVYAYIRVSLDEQVAESVRTALRYDSGDPALLTARVGDGRIALVTTTADTEWTTWPVWPSYVPVMQELARYLVAPDLSRWNLEVGTPLVLPPEPGLGQVRVSAELPDGTRLDRLWEADQSELRLVETWYAGLVRLQLGPPEPRQLLYAFNPPRSESDLARVDPDELRGLLGGLPVRYVRDLDTGQNGTEHATRQGSELHRPLLYAALLLLVVELALACRLNRPR